MSKVHKKIFVIGFCDRLTEDQIKTIFKESGFKNEIECINGQKLKNIVTNKCFTKEYALAIFVGPMPHKVKNANGGNSLYSILLSCPHEYPPVIRVSPVGSSEFKITRSSLHQAIAIWKLKQNAES